MANVTRDIGPVSAYALAVKHGYKGTEEEWARLQMEAGANAQRAENAASASEASAQLATAQAADAASSATAAETSARGAAESSTNAKSSEDAAAESEEAAKESADAAAEARTAAEVSALHSESAAERAEEAAQTQAQIDDAVASLERVWSSRRTIDRLCPAFEKSGRVVSCYPVEGYPLGVRSRIEAVQEGSGDPSPENVRPISGWESARLTRCGKNLLPYPYEDKRTNMNGITYTDNGDGTITINGTATSTSYFQFVINSPLGVPAGMAAILWIHKTNEDIRMSISNRVTGKLYVGKATGVLFETEAEPVEIYLAIDAGKTFNNVVITPQIELGTAATEYEPYQGDAYAVQFGETVYGGVMDWNTGELTVTMESLTFDGTEYISQTTNQQGVKYYTYNLTGKYKHSDKQKSTHLRRENSVGNGDKCFLITNSLFIRNDSITTVEDMRNWLADNKVTFIAELTEPYAIPLDPQLIPALHGVNSIWSDAGETAVSGRTDPVHVMETMQERLAALENAVINNI